MFPLCGAIWMRRTRALLAGAVAIAAGSACVSSRAPSSDAESYLNWVAFKVPVNESVLLRWPKSKMPLRVFLPRPPAGWFENPEAIHDSVRDGILDWSGVAGPDLPSFVFVDAAGEADIPIIWESRPHGDWYIASCAFDIQPFARRFGVSRIFVTARWRDGYVADLHDVYATVLHEVGHALGLAGHSPDPHDVMYEAISRRPDVALSARDRATLKALYARPIGSRIAGARHK